MSKINQVRGLCPCAIQAKHNPNWKPTICGCLGPDALYEDCAGDYAEYNRRRMERDKHLYVSAPYIPMMRTNAEGEKYFVSTNGVKLTPEMMKDLTCTSWPRDSGIPADQQRLFEKRMAEVAEGIILYD